MNERCPDFEPLTDPAVIAQLNAALVSAQGPKITNDQALIAAARKVLGLVVASKSKTEKKRKRVGDWLSFILSLSLYIYIYL